VTSRRTVGGADHPVPAGAWQRLVLPGRQYPLVVNGKAYFLDLLFYHAVEMLVIELEAGELEPRIRRQTKFLLAVDDQGAATVTSQPLA
jgi:hypothetical protein